MKRTGIERLLPNVFQRVVLPGSPLSAILDVMEVLHTPVEDVLSRMDSYFSPYRAPDSFVPLLAQWVDLDRFFLAETPEGVVLRIPQEVGQLRELVAIAAQLSQLRGTRHGLELFLETATGITGFEIDEAVRDSDGSVRPFHICVRVPAEARRHRALIEKIVEQERPAHLTYEVRYADRTDAEQADQDVTE
jgi:phage tail-like protein